MKFRVIGVVALLLVAKLAVPAVAAPPQLVKAELTLPYETVLPGVPFDMTVTLKNVSSSTVSVGIAARLIATLPDGTTISPKKWHHLDPIVNGNEPPFVELAPGESRQFFVDWHDGIPSLFYSSEYSGPGVYELALALEDEKAEGNYVGSIVTNAVRLTRSVTPGDDQALWERMLAAGSGEWSDNGFGKFKEGQNLMREILKLHPGSAYYPYALLIQAQLEHPQTTKDDIATALEAAARFQSSPAYPHLLLRAADIACSIASYADHDRDYKTFFEYFALAEHYYDEAAKKSTVVAVRSHAERGRQIAHNEMEHQRQRMAGTYGKVQ